MRPVPSSARRKSQLEKGAIPFARDSDRNPCAVPCKMLVQHGEIGAVLRDFSERGFRVSTESLLFVGTEADLVLPGCMPVRAKVMWSLGGMAGCRFEHPIKEHLMRMAIGNAQAGQAHSGPGPSGRSG